MSVNTFQHNQPFTFEHGGQVPELTLVYETYGELAPKKDNVVIIHHALSTSSHVASHPQDTSPGWWEAMVGPGKPIDSNKFYVICINNLGSCFGSTSPISTHPDTGKPYQADFPVLTMKDVARSQKLLLNSLGIKTIYALVGNSMGAMISLEWALAFPESVQRFLSVSSCYKAYPANMANRLVQKRAITLDPNYQNGAYNVNPVEGLKVARMLGHYTYRNPEALNDKFATNIKLHIDDVSDIESYLEYNANKFAQKFDANCYLTLMHAMDLFNVAKATPDKPEQAFSQLTCPSLIVSVDSDILFTPRQQLELFQAMKTAGVPVELIEHHSEYGHDAFLVETDAFGRYISGFLAA